VNPRWSAAILLTMAIGSCKAQPSSKPVSLRPVRVHSPEPSTCSVSPRFSGNVEPLVRVDLAFKRGGYVEALERVTDAGTTRPIDQGDVVKKGAVVASLRSADFRVKVQQAKAQLAQARLAEAQARRDLERVKELSASGSVAKSVLEAADTQAEATRAQVQAAAAAVEEASLALQDSTLRAPLDATVLKRLVEVGSLVGPGSPGFVLADTSSMKVVFGVPDVMLSRVQLGASIEVTLDAVSRLPRQGHVGRVAPAADPTSRLFDVEVLLPNPDGTLRAGMIASLRAVEAPTASVLAVPMSALVRPPGKSEGFAVFVADGEALRVRPVQPGEFCGRTVEILSGIALGDRVVVEGAASSFDGERIAILP
jgi:multidrug efflux system membrane fusion protein